MWFCQRCKEKRLSYSKKCDFVYFFQIQRMQRETSSLLEKVWLQPQDRHLLLALLRVNWLLFTLCPRGGLVSVVQVRPCCALDNCLKEWDSQTHLSDSVNSVSMIIIMKTCMHPRLVLKMCWGRRKQITVVDRETIQYTPKYTEINFTICKTSQGGMSAASDEHQAVCS